MTAPRIAETREQLYRCDFMEPGGEPEPVNMVDLVDHVVRESGLADLLRECQAALTGPAELRQRIEDAIGRPPARSAANGVRPCSDCGGGGCASCVGSGQEFDEATFDG